MSTGDWDACRQVMDEWRQQDCCSPVLPAALLGRAQTERRHAAQRPLPPYPRVQQLPQQEEAQQPQPQARRWRSAPPKAQRAERRRATSPHAFPDLTALSPFAAPAVQQQQQQQQQHSCAARSRSSSEPPEPPGPGECTPCASPPQQQQAGSAPACAPARAPVAPQGPPPPSHGEPLLPGVDMWALAMDALHPQGAASKHAPPPQPPPQRQQPQPQQQAAQQQAGAPCALQAQQQAAPSDRAAALEQFLERLKHVEGRLQQQQAAAQQQQVAQELRRLAAHMRLASASQPLGGSPAARSGQLLGQGASSELVQALCAARELPPSPLTTLEGQPSLATRSTRSTGSPPVSGGSQPQPQWGGAPAPPPPEALQWGGAPPLLLVVQGGDLRWAAAPLAATLPAQQAAPGLLRQQPAWAPPQPQPQAQPQPPPLNPFAQHLRRRPPPPPRQPQQSWLVGAGPPVVPQLEQALSPPRAKRAPSPEQLSPALAERQRAQQLLLAQQRADHASFCQLAAAVLAQPQRR